MLAHRTFIITTLAEMWNRLTYREFLTVCSAQPGSLKILKPGKPIFVVLGPAEEEKTRYLPNTILVAFINPREIAAYGPPPQDIQTFCNKKLKKTLDKDNVVVSITSACLTSSEKASHVLRAIEAPTFIKRGVIRISTSDYTTEQQVKIFIKKLQTAVEKQIF